MNFSLTRNGKLVKVMHVCLVTSNRPSEIFYGGIERFIILLKDWLRNNGCEVTIIGRTLFGTTVIKSSDAPWANIGNKQAPPRTLRLPYTAYALCMSIISLLLALRIIAINRKSKISIIHSQDTGYGGLASLIAAKILNVPVILTTHGIRYIFLSKSLNGALAKLALPFEYWLDITVTKKSDAIIVVNKTEKEYFTRRGVRKDKINIVPIGIETDKFKVNRRVREEIRREFSIQKDCILIGFIGRFSQEKNLFTLLTAFVEASKCADNMDLMLVGAGSLEEKLRKLFSNNKELKEKVVFTGIRYDVNRILSALDIFILPSYTEGCPTALLEAMISEKAIIASAIPAIREIIEDGKEGLLFNPHDAQQLTNHILTLYNNPELRKKLGENAKRKAIQYDVNKIFKKITQIYYEVLKKSNKKGF